MKRKGDILLLTIQDITSFPDIDISHISHKNPSTVKYVGFFHSEDEEAVRLKNYDDGDTADVLVIPKSLITSRKKINVG